MHATSKSIVLFFLATISDDSIDAGADDFEDDSDSEDGLDDAHAIPDEIGLAIFTSDASRW